MHKLFKFVADETAVKSLADGNVKFTRMSKLNDPLELFGIAEEQQIMDSLNHYRTVGYNNTDYENLIAQEKLLRKLAPHSPILPVPATPEEATQMLQQPFYSNIAVLKNILTTVKTEILKNTGAFCLSKRYDSLPMWAHYANNAQGFVVEFQDLESYFTPDNTGVLNLLSQVNYTHMPCITFTPDSHKKIFFSKHKDWSYENEFRVLKSISDCKEKEHNLFLSSIPKEKVKRVIIGWNFKGNVQALSNEIKKGNPDIIISLAKISYQDSKVIFVDEKNL